MVIMLRGGGVGVTTCKTNDKKFLYKISLTWSSGFFALTGYSVLNLQREYSKGNKIKTYLFERPKAKNCSIYQKKGRT